MQYHTPTTAATSYGNKRGLLGSGFHSTPSTGPCRALSTVAPGKDLLLLLDTPHFTLAAISASYHAGCRTCNVTPWAGAMPCEPHQPPPTPSSVRSFHPSTILRLRSVSDLCHHPSASSLQRVHIQPCSKPTSFCSY